MKRLQTKDGRQSFVNEILDKVVTLKDGILTIDSTAVVPNTRYANRDGQNAVIFSQGKNFKIGIQCIPVLPQEKKAIGNATIAEALRIAQKRGIEGVEKQMVTVQVDGDHSQGEPIKVNLADYEDFKTEHDLRFLTPGSTVTLVSVRDSSYRKARKLRERVNSAVSLARAVVKLDEQLAAAEFFSNQETPKAPKAPKTNNKSELGKAMVDAVTTGQGKVESK